MGWTIVFALIALSGSAYGGAASSVSAKPAWVFSTMLFFLFLVARVIRGPER